MVSFEAAITGGSRIAFNKFAVALVTKLVVNAANPIRARSLGMTQEELATSDAKIRGEIIDFLSEAFSKKNILKTLDTIPAEGRRARAEVRAANPVPETVPFRPFRDIEEAAERAGLKLARLFLR